MCVELTITVKDEEGRKLSITYLEYSSFSMDESDPIIQGHVKELLEEFKGIPDDIKVRATTVLR
jgi:hypothetical protein